MELINRFRDLKEQGASKYLLVNVVARRARLLKDGARAEVPLAGDNPMDLTRVALAEMDAGKLRVEPKERAGQLVDIAGIVR